MQVWNKAVAEYRRLESEVRSLERDKELHDKAKMEFMRERALFEEHKAAEKQKIERCLDKAKRMLAFAQCPKVVKSEQEDKTMEISLQKELQLKIKDKRMMQQRMQQRIQELEAENAELRTELARSHQTIVFPNGTKKTLLSSGALVTTYTNGDLKRTFADGTVEYTYFTGAVQKTINGITTTTFPCNESDSGRRLRTQSIALCETVVGRKMRTGNSSGATSIGSMSPTTPCTSVKTKKSITSRTITN